MHEQGFPSSVPYPPSSSDFLTASQSFTDTSADWLPATSTSLTNVVPLLSSTIVEPISSSQSPGVSDSTSGTVSCTETIWLTTTATRTTTATISWITNVGGSPPPGPAPPAPPISTLSTSSCTETTGSAGTVGIPNNTSYSVASGSIPAGGPQSSPPCTCSVPGGTVVTTFSTTTLSVSASGGVGGNTVGSIVPTPISASGYGGQPGNTTAIIPEPGSQSASPPPPPPPAQSSPAPPPPAITSFASTSTLTSITTKTSSVSSTHTSPTGIPAATGGAMSIGPSFDTRFAGFVATVVWAVSFAL
ncbi:hypothetical protein H2200_009167 [Cladophialophora chaetospira]|uniref:Uncharacterized protein n=1 Tax=Cladophialophora chaetospira TaxID=386627 RepID=A0AA39CFB0_9EURO|nr:hypothetical protein H2200_009167 [Cladophialophora chaetospira]